jgi:hypothetical protein
MEEQIGSSSIVTLMNTARDGKETLSLVRDLKRRQFKRLLDAPVKPDFTVGLDFHLNQLKSWLLSSGVSVRVLTGLGGSGKTTLATLLCWDDQVRGNIYNFFYTFITCVYLSVLYFMLKYVSLLHK